VLDKGDIDASRLALMECIPKVQHASRSEDLLSPLTEAGRGAKEIVLRGDAIDIRLLVDKLYEQAQQLAHGRKLSHKVAWRGNHWCVHRCR